jgi:hypothetical protein
VGKKSYGRKRRPHALVNRALHPIPQRYITKMKYHENVLVPVTGYAFNLNSIWDPNRTGIGHQPYGFDTLATLYNRYRVISCGWRVCVNAVPGTANNCLGVIPSNEVLTFATMSELRENPRARYVTQSSGGGIVWCSGKTYIPSLVGRNKAQYMADDRYQASTTSSPNELAVLNCLTSTVSNTADGETPTAQYLQVLLEYTVEFFDIKNLAQS